MAKLILPLGAISKKTGKPGCSWLYPGQRERLDDAIVKLVEERNPVSLRYVYYRLVTGELDVQIPKVLAEYTRLSRILCELRGKIPKEDRVEDGAKPKPPKQRKPVRIHPSAIYDGTREFNPTPYLDETSPWFKSDVIPLLICESSSTEGMLKDVANKYQIGLTSLRGQPSFTIKDLIFEFMNAASKPVRIYYVGDYDKAGYDIPGELLDFIRSSIVKTTPQISFNRLAITEEIIKKFDLPVVEAEKPKPGFLTTTEAEALTITQLETIVSEALDLILPPGALEFADQMLFGIEFDNDITYEWGRLVGNYIRNGGELSDLDL
jgi:hypothetical protein